MTARYTVAENLFGYEPEPLQRPWCRFAVIDNAPTRQSVYSARERCAVLVHLTGPLAFRQVAFCVHRSDADALADAMNRSAEPALPLVRVSQAPQ